MHTVLTLTANLLAETTYTYDTAWSAGGTHRARSEFFQVGGKGINVTHMLTRFEATSIALLFPGGPTGERCTEWLLKKKIPHHAFPNPHPTRSGAVVRAPGLPETTFLGRDCKIERADIAACVEFLATQPAHTMLAICGSVPGWLDSTWEPLRAFLSVWTQAHPLIVDTYGPPLADLVRLPVALVKINRREFAGIANVSVAEATDARMAGLLARVANDNNAARWIITDGPNRVWFCERGAPVEAIQPPRIEEVSQTGSGDVFLAAVLYALFERRHDLAGAVKFALPVAAANAASPTVAEFDLKPFGLTEV